MKNNYHTYLFLLLTLATIPLFAQAPAKGHQRYSEAEVMAEAEFVEANSLFLLGKYDKALTKFKDFLKQNPKAAPAYFNLGRTQVELGHSEQGFAAMQKAIDLEPHPWYFIHLAEMYESEGQALDAARTMEDMARRYPKKDFAYKKAAYYYLLAQKPDKALNVLNEAEKNIGFDPEINDRKHIIFLALGKTSLAIEALRKNLKVLPKATEYRLKLAEIYEHTGQEDLAEKEYQAILSYDPYNAGALLGLQKRKISEAGTDLNALTTMVANPSVRIDLKITELVPLVSRLSSGTGENTKTQWRQIAQSLQQAHPEDPKAYSMAGDIYYAIGDYDKALEAYERTLQKEKAVFTVWRQVLELHFVAKNYDKVIKTAQQALDYFPNKSAIMLFLAEAQFRKKNVHQAISDYKQAGFMSGKNRSQKRFIFARIAEIYLSAGDKANAAKYLNKAQEQDTEHDPYLDHVKKEVKNGSLIPYDAQWLKDYPTGILLL